MAFRSTIRSLIRARSLSVTIIITVALGIAALTTTFGVVNAALFRQPPFDEADRVVMLFIQRNPQGEAPRRERWSFGRFELLARSQQSFEQLASYSPAAVTLSGQSNAQLVNAERVSASYFALLRTTPLRGRFFSAAEDDPISPTPVVVISESMWAREFGRDSEILGRTIRLNGVPLTIIGIVPAGFSGLSGRSEMWIPRTMSAQITYPEYVTTNQNFISVAARLRPGVTIDAARSELAVLGANINRALPSDPENPAERVTASAVPINEARTDDNVRRSLLVLLGAVALVHLLACANVTNLLLGRATAKGRDSAVRIALGSSGGQLFSRLFSEGFTLAVVGGVVGIVLAKFASTLIAPPTNVWAPVNFYGSIAPFDSPQFGTTELLFGVTLAFTTAVLVSIPPALSAFRIDVSRGIRDGSRSLSRGGLSLRRPSARAIIVGLEAALAMVLIVAAGLLVDSFRRMQNVDIGVDPRNVLTFWVIPSEAKYPPETAHTFVSRLLDAVSRAPGVISATVDGGGPVVGAANSTLLVGGRPEPDPGQAPPVLRHYIGPDHFRTLGIPLRRGRAFTPSDDAHSPRVVIISEGAAGKFWPNEDPIGKRVWFGSGLNFNSSETSGEIIGIVADVAYSPLDRQPDYASFYTPFTQFTYPSRMVFLKTAGNPMSVVPDVRNALATVDPDVAMRDVQSLTDVIAGSRSRDRFDALLFSGFGAAALFLAASGIFTVLAYAVTTRTREFGIRIAVGATPRRVVLHVLGEGMVFPTIGLVVGTVAAIAGTRVLESSLYEVNPLEMPVFLFTGLLLFVVAVCACLIPALRATRTDPVEALRSE